MLILFIFIQLISYSIQNYVIFIDQLFKLYKISSISTELCPNLESSKYYYRGRPSIFTDIINETNNNKQVLNNLKNKNFKVIYVEKGYYLSSVYLFSENTVFLVNMSETINKTNPNLKNYCILRVNMNIQINGNFYYIIIGEDKNDDFLINAISSLILLYLLVFFFLFINIFKNCIHYIPSQIVYIFTFVNKIIIGIFIASVSAIFINFFLLSSILYSLYKSYILIHIIFLLNGYSILNYNYFTLKQRKKYWLILFLIEFILDLFFEYIIYFIPSINNYYLFLIKSFFEHCTILVVTIISFCNNFNRLFKQYKFDRRLRTILTIGYRIKVIMYGKIILFSFLYSTAFILLYLIEMIYSIYLTTFSFYYNYAFNIGLEMFFGILLSIFFSSFKISFLFYYPIYYDYDSLRFSAKIKECKEKEFKISNLKKNMIKNEYQKKEYPLILINPFTKTDNVFKDFHIGMVEKKNKKY